MSEVKDRRICGECRYLQLGGDYIAHYYICLKHENEFPHESVDYDMEACSDFEPEGGWRE